MENEAVSLLTEEGTEYDPKEATSDGYFRINNASRRLPVSFSKAIWLSVLLTISVTANVVLLLNRSNTGVSSVSPYGRRPGAKV
jgi:hypothetical protein